jgi:hypothetical protein
MLTRFDAYTATTRASQAQELFPLVWQIGDKIRQGRGHHGFKERVSFTSACGTEAGSISWGGTHGDLVMIEAKGERTPDAVEKLRASVPEHRCTRVDSCYDVEEPGAFDSLLKPCLQVKKDYKLKGSKAGDWEDFPEDGRTLYVGANTSPVKLRLYEKGHQPEYRHLSRPDWVRIELQVRPTKDAKDTYSRADSLAVWGASAWTRELAGLVLAAELAPLPAGTTYKLSEQESALRFMCKQYGLHLIGLRNDLGGWEEVGLKLAEIIRKERSRTV